MNTPRAASHSRHASSSRIYGLSDLCEMFGFTARQVRDFRAKGALQPPEGVGRGAYYTDEHVKRLGAIKPLVEAGISVSRIAARYSAAETSMPARGTTGEEIMVERWDRVRVGPGLELAMLVGSGLENRRLELMRHLVSEAKRLLARRKG